MLSSRKQSIGSAIGLVKLLPLGWVVVFQPARLRCRRSWPHGSPHTRGRSCCRPASVSVGDIASMQADGHVNPGLWTDCLLAVASGYFSWRTLLLFGLCARQLIARGEDKPGCTARVPSLIAGCTTSSNPPVCAFVAGAEGAAGSAGHHLLGDHGGRRAGILFRRPHRPAQAGAHRKLAAKVTRSRKSLGKSRAASA